jgi:hypothetical protein
MVRESIFSAAFKIKFFLLHLKSDFSSTIVRAFSKRNIIFFLHFCSVEVFREIWAETER